MTKTVATALSILFVVIGAVYFAYTRYQCSQAVLTDTLQIAANLFTSAAVVFGGIWTWQVFVRKRVRMPHANLTHTFTHCPLDERYITLRVKVTLSNTGNVAIAVPEAEVRVSQVLPVSEEMKKELSNMGEGPVKGRDNLREIEWIPCYTSKREFGKGGCVIEPGEEDEFCHDFKLPRITEAVQVYSYIKNVQAKGKTLGWHATDIYFLTENRQKRQNSAGGVCSTNTEKEREH